MFHPETKILILDDMVGIRQTLKNILKDIGFTDITAVENGQIGWELIMKSLDDGQRFQLILSDWNMPVLTGIELLKKVRAFPDIADTPFLLVTAEGEFANVKSALEWKVNAYVVKPFTPAAIKAKLEQVWKQTQAKASGGAKPGTAAPKAGAPAAKKPAA